MAELDTSIYARRPPGPGPLDTIQSMINAKKGMIETSKAGYDFTAQQLFAKGVQENWDPATNTLNKAGFAKWIARPENASAAPAAAAAGLELTGKELSNVGQGITNQKAAQDLAGGGAKNVGDIFAGLLAQPKPPTYDEVFDALITRSDLVKEPGQLGKYLKAIPRGDDPASVAARVKYLQGFAVSAMPSPMSEGPSRVDPNTGAEVGTTSGGAAVAKTTPTLEGDLGGGFTTKLPPLAEQSIADAKALIQRGSVIPDQLANLQRMEAASEGFSAGTFSDEMNTAATAVGQLFGINIQSVADKDEFDKLAKAMIAVQGGALGTDLGLMTATGANPNSSMSNMSIKQILHMLQGNAAAEMAQYNEFIKSGAPAAKFAEWRVKNWNPHFDPRVYQIQFMVGPDGFMDDEGEHFRDQLIAKKQWYGDNKVKAKWEYAIAHGLVPDPRDKQ